MVKNEVAFAHTLLLHAKSHLKSARLQLFVGKLSLEAHCTAIELFNRHGKHVTAIQGWRALGRRMESLAASIDDLHRELASPARDGVDDYYARIDVSCARSHLVEALHQLHENDMSFAELLVSWAQQHLTSARNKDCSATG